jgi:hypothetical protein
MELLEKSFKGRGSQNGYEFEQLERDGNIGLYRKEGAGTYYEVIIIRQRDRNEATIGGKLVVFEAKEAYPSDEDFGTYGWCLTSEERARSVFQREINKREAAKS